MPGLNSASITPNILKAKTILVTHIILSVRNISVKVFLLVGSEGKFEFQRRNVEGELGIFPFPNSISNPVSSGVHFSTYLELRKDTINAYPIKSQPRELHRILPKHEC